ncbi:branched-chain amino acid ABC transporter permease [Candidatus Poriferisodalis sp.]|uniref:branched-chain amino acid ABC transporter permease n=1 Tax=Candidatus Poriferisodalis sp. TaxID=3101277 RepID=UPI003B516B72
MSGDGWPTPLPRPGDDDEVSGADASVFAVFAPPGEAEPEATGTSETEHGQPGPPTAGVAAEKLPPDPSQALPRSRRISPLSWIGALLAGAWLVVMPLTSTVTEMRQNTQIVVMVLAVLGVNIATGYGGMISLGHGVFVAVGSFAAAYAVDDLGLPWILSILAGAVVAGLVGALVGLPALRIKGIHLALVTLGLAIVFQPLAKRVPAFSGGVSGRAVGAELVPPAWFGTSRWAEGLYRYLICLAIVALAMWVTHNIINSRPGRAMRAIRDNDTAAAVYGVKLVATRVNTFAMSASLAGLAGALGVVLVPFTSQESYPFQESLVLYATAVLGGLGSLWGSVLGVAIREVFSRIGELVSGVSGLGPLSEFLSLLDEEQFVFGVLLVALTFIFPRGLVGMFTRRRGAQAPSSSSKRTRA